MTTQSPKHTRTREERVGHRVRKIVQAFLRANPERMEANPKYRCPAGPGKRVVSVEGAWYDLDEFMVRRYACGDCADATPGAESVAPAPDKRTKTAKPEPGDAGGK